MRSREQMEKETEIAKNVDIIAVAKYLGANVKRQGSTYKDKDDEGLVFFPNTNSFFHFYYDGIGGSPIDYVMYRNNVGVQEAIKCLIEISGQEITYGENEIPSHNLRKSADIDFVLPEPNETHRRVFAYLAKERCIDKEVIKKMLHEKRLYESKDNHNAVFVGYDLQGNAKHAFLRSTISNRVWRGDVSGSDKSYAFSVPGSNNRLIVFEAPIDLLSYITLYPKDQSHMVALGMLSSEPIYRYLEEHPDVKDISFALDMDEKGMDATRRYAAEFKRQGYDCSNNKVLLEVIQEKCKDINELVCKYSKEQEYINGRGNR